MKTIIAVLLFVNVAYACIGTWVCDAPVTFGATGNVNIYQSLDGACGQSRVAALNPKNNGQNGFSVWSDPGALGLGNGYYFIDFTGITCIETIRQSNLCRTDSLPSGSDIRFHVSVRNDVNVKFNCDGSAVCSYPAGPGSFTPDLYTDLDVAQTPDDNPCDCQGTNPATGCADFSPVPVFSFASQVIAVVPYAKRGDDLMARLITEDLHYWERSNPETYKDFVAMFA